MHVVMHIMKIMRMARITRIMRITATMRMMALAILSVNRMYTRGSRFPATQLQPLTSTMTAITTIIVTTAPAIVM